MNFSGQILARMPQSIPLNRAMWEDKHSIAELDPIRTGDPYTWDTQYQQNGTLIGGAMFKDKWWRHWEILPNDIDIIRIYGDTAQKTREHNDYTVFQCWAHSISKGIFLLDQCRGKWEAPELESKLVEFWQKHKSSQFNPFGAQCVMIEDKSSGSSLIQSIKRNYTIPIEPIQRNTDKVLRAMGVVKYFASGFIHLPLDCDWTFDYKEEFRKFNAKMTHKHDDQIDPTMDAVEDLLAFSGMIYNSANVG